MFTHIVCVACFFNLFLHKTVFVSSASVCLCVCSGVSVCLLGCMCTCVVLRQCSSHVLFDLWPWPGDDTLPFM